jgi:23S rRNA pseudouridine1911/1915/1917 synthase
MPKPIFRDATYPAPQRAAPLDRALRAHHEAASWAELRRLISTGKVQVNGETETNPARLVEPGDALSIRMSAPRLGRRTSLPPDAIVYADAHVVVAYKPAGMMSIPFEDERETFVDLVRRALEKRGGRVLAPLGVVHRIDKDTSGLLVFTRRASAKRSLEQQFRAHSVYRAYAALVHGRLRSCTFRSRLIADRGDGLRGSTHNAKLGQLAVTHVTAVETFRDATFVECKLETGRTHQIRVHLSEAGHPLLGERVYIRGYQGSIVPAPRLMLHALALGFEHPAHGRAVKFTSELPPEMRATIAELRRASLPPSKP